MKKQNEFQAAIVGAGPVGLSLALDLARKGIHVLVVDKKPQLDPHSRATIIHSRTLEIFAQLGVLDRFLSHGERVPHVHLELPSSGRTIVHLDFTELINDTEAAFALALSQDKTERILLDAVNEMGFVDVRFSVEAVGFEQSGNVRLQLIGVSGQDTITSQYLIGADGAHSLIREQLGLKLDGKTYPTRALLADVRVEAKRDRLGVWPTLLNHAGFVTAIRFGNGVWRIIEQSVAESVTDGTIDEHVRTLATELFGAAPLEIEWRNTYRKHERSASRFRVGRVVLAGDAAHLNSPAGGQGMNSGIQDAHNLGWKLALSITQNDANSESLLESYSQERFSLIARDVQPFTDIAERFQTAPPFAREAVVSLADRLFGFSKSASSMTRRLSMLDVKYNSSCLLCDHKAPVGHRLPDVLDDEGQRLYRRLRDGGILWAGDGSGVAQLAKVARVPAFRCEVSSLAKFFQNDKFVAIIRPDQIVGFVTAPASVPSEYLEFSKAMGKGPPTWQSLKISG